MANLRSFQGSPPPVCASKGCDCEGFVPHDVRKKICNYCYHKIDLHRTSESSDSDSIALTTKPISVRVVPGGGDKEFHEELVSDDSTGAHLINREGSTPSWQRLFDKQKDAHFFFNRSTGESRWHPPEGWVGETESEQKPGAQRSSPWKKVFDSKYEEYFYYNSITDESQWEPPEGWEPKPVDLEQQPVGKTGGGVSDWQKLYHTEYEQHYYYNKVTDVSQWDPPRGWGSARMSGSAVPGASAWEKKFHEGYQEYFYYNHSTDESQWDPPVGWEGGGAEVEGQNRASSASRHSKASSAWSKVFDETFQDHFYYNSVTDESQWDPPEGWEDKEGGAVLTIRSPPDTKQDDSRLPSPPTKVERHGERSQEPHTNRKMPGQGLKPGMPYLNPVGRKSPPPLPSASPSPSPPPPPLAAEVQMEANAPVSHNAPTADAKATRVISSDHRPARSTAIGSSVAERTASVMMNRGKPGVFAGAAPHRKPEPAHKSLTVSSSPTSPPAQDLSRPSSERPAGRNGKAKPSSEMDTIAQTLALVETMEPGEEADQIKQMLNRKMNKLREGSRSPEAPPSPGSPQTSNSSTTTTTTTVAERMAKIKARSAASSATANHRPPSLAPSQNQQQQKQQQQREEQVETTERASLGTVAERMARMKARSAAASAAANPPRPASLTPPQKQQQQRGEQVDTTERASLGTVAERMARMKALSVAAALRKQNGPAPTSPPPPGGGGGGSQHPGQGHTNASPPSMAPPPRRPGQPVRGVGDRGQDYSSSSNSDIPIKAGLVAERMASMKLRHASTGLGSPPAPAGPPKADWRRV